MTTWLSAHQQTENNAKSESSNSKDNLVAPTAAGTPSELNQEKYLFLLHDWKIWVLLQPVLTYKNNSLFVQCVYSAELLR